VYVTDATLAATFPAEHSLRDVTAAQMTPHVPATADTPQAEFEPAESPDWIVEPLWDRPADLAIALVSPVRVLSEVEGSEWRAAVALMGFAIALRALVYTVQMDADPLPITLALIGQVLGPMLYIGVVGGLLLAIGAATRRPRPAEVFSLAALTAAPVALRCVVQSIAMIFLQRGVSATGILGVIAPKASPVLLWLLGPLDVFGLWTLGLIGVAIYTVLARASRAEQLQGTITQP
jgi:hypothetical protein